MIEVFTINVNPLHYEGVTHLDVGTNKSKICYKTTKISINIQSATVSKRLTFSLKCHESQHFLYLLHIWMSYLNVQLRMQSIVLLQILIS